MEFTINQLLGMEPTLDKLKDKKVPFKVAYKLTKLYNAVHEELQFYYTKLNEIIQKYGELNEDGTPKYIDNGIKIKSDKLADAQKEIDELIGVYVSLPEIKIKTNDFDKVDICIDDLAPIMDFFEE